MKYIYPQFTQHELPFIRLGGAGLGNLLFIYARALVIAEQTGAEMIYPTWPCIKIGPILRHEKDKRFYFDLFQNGKNYVSGLKKYKLLYFGHKKAAHSAEDVTSASDGTVFCYSDFFMNFTGLLPYRKLIYEDIIANLKPKNRKPLEADFSHSVNVHVRCGDFSASNNAALLKGANNTRIPVSWYADVIRQLQSVLGDRITFNIFSDGTDEELREILNLPNTQRVCYGTSIADILALSRAKLMIASGSSFSMWARFLGNCSSISYTNQRKDFVAEEDKFEIETNGELGEETLAELKKSYVR